MLVIPAHWTIHDGQGMPVDAKSSPAVMFRRKAYGMRTPLTMQMGTFHAGKWEDYGSRDCWKWLPGDEDDMDIVAHIEDTGVRTVPESVGV